MISHSNSITYVQKCTRWQKWQIWRKSSTIDNVSKISDFGDLLPPYCFVLCPVGNCGNIIIFATFAKFASIANFYGPPSLLCALPCWRLWQYCHFCHICQIRHYVLFFCHFCCCVHFWTYLGKTITVFHRCYLQNFSFVETPNITQGFIKKN